VGHNSWCESRGVKIHWTLGVPTPSSGYKQVLNGMSYPNERDVIRYLNTCLQWMMAFLLWQVVLFGALHFKWCVCDGGKLLMLLCKQLPFRCVRFSSVDSHKSSSICVSNGTLWFRNEVHRLKTCIGITSSKNEDGTCSLGISPLKNFFCNEHVHRSALRKCKFTFRWICGSSEFLSHPS